MVDGNFISWVDNKLKAIDSRRAALKQDYDFWTTVRTKYLLESETEPSAQEAGPDKRICPIPGEVCLRKVGRGKCTN